MEKERKVEWRNGEGEESGREEGRNGGKEVQTKFVSITVNTVNTGYNVKRWKHRRCPSLSDGIDMIASVPHHPE